MNLRKNKILNAIFRASLAAAIMFMMAVNAYAGTEPMDQARDTISTYYVDQVSDTVLDSSATIDEMVEALNDPHSTYFTAEEYDDFINSINNEFSGIGVYIEIVPEGVLITSVIEGSPSEAEGLRAGDIITEADTYPLAGLSSEEATSHIKGEEGTTVSVKVKRGQSHLTFNVMRKRLDLPTVGGGMLNDSTAYISISTFGEGTLEEFEDELSMLEGMGAEGYIIDLRNNPGGFLATAVDMAGFFIGEKPVLLTRDREGNEDEYTAPQYPDKIEDPVIFLINGYSASASEILSAAVKDHGSAFLMGSRTYGKGTVQSMFSLSDGSVLKLTVEKFFSPLGHAINKVGVQPDLETEDGDPAMMAALLLGRSGGGQDKRGYQMIKIGDREFEIDMDTARNTYFDEMYRYILDRARLSGYEVRTGTSSGWSDALIERIAGSDRYKTALEVSRTGWAEGSAPDVVLASGEDFPDALCAGPLAKKLGAPVLLTGRTNLPEGIYDELERLGAQNVYIVGGSGVVASSVEEQLENKGINCIRAAGKDRYETSVEVAKLIEGSDEIAVAAGSGFADALSISPIAAAKGMPIILTSAHGLPQSVSDYLEEMDIKTSYVIGGEGVIGKDAEGLLPGPVRVYGRDRYETNIAVLEKFSDDMDLGTVYAATGMSFPDALSGSVLASKTSSPIILTGSVPGKSTKDYVSGKSPLIDRIRVLGWEGAVPEVAVQEMLSRPIQ